MPGEEHSALVYKWRLLPDFWLNNGFSPQEASIATLCRVLHRQRIDLFTIISSPRNFVECLYCDVSPVPILPVLYRFIKSPVIYRLYILTFTHSYIQTFIHSHIHTYIHTYIHSYNHTFIHQYFHIFIHIIYTTSLIHGCISHPEFCVVRPLEFGPHSSLCSSGKFQQTNSLNPFKSVIPSVSG